MKPVRIDVVSDVMCPWCYIGKRRLEQAIEEVDDQTVEIRWRPFQLDPTLPREGRDRKEYLEKKFGGPERAREIYTRIEEAGRADDLDFKFSRIEISPNTIDAHRVIRWSINEGEEVQDKLVERLFHLYFIEGANIADHEVLTTAASEAGMDGTVVAALLATDQDREAVAEEVAVAQRMGVNGVPCFILNNKYAVIGAQTSAHIAEAIRQTAREAEENV